MGNRLFPEIMTPSQGFTSKPMKPSQISQAVLLTIGFALGVVAASWYLHDESFRFGEMCGVILNAVVETKCDVLLPAS